MNTIKKILICIIAAAVIALSLWFGLRFFFVLGDGVKAGNLNQVVYKGWIWKTYEGRIIMSGFKNDRSSKGGGIHSNEFNFSVDKKAIGYRANGSTYSVADSLMRCSGKNVPVRSKEYKGSLPWRGMQKYIVYEILSVSNPSETNTIPIETE